MPIHPIEPNPEETDAELQQKLMSERAAAMMEEVTFDDEEIGPMVRDGRDQRYLGEPISPRLLSAEVNLPANMSMSIEQASRQLGELVERQIRESLASAIADDDLDEYVWIPLSLVTVDEKKKKGMAKPTTPLYGTGELVENLRQGWVSQYTWTDQTLSINFGPTAENDLNPSMKYHDMFFGNRGVGRHHKTVIPRRFPRLTNNDRERIRLMIEDFVRLNEDHSFVDSHPTDAMAVWSNGAI